MRDAAAGFAYALKTQRNMRIHVGVALAVVVLAVVSGVEGVEWGLLLAAIGGVFGAELLNTAVEAAVDLSVHEWHPVAKVAKDAAAAAVLVQAVVASALGYVVFAPRVPAPLGLFPAIFWIGAAWAARRARNGSGPQGG